MEIGNLSSILKQKFSETKIGFETKVAEKVEMPGAKETAEEELMLAVEDRKEALTSNTYNWLMILCKEVRDQRENISDILYKLDAEASLSTKLRGARIKMRELQKCNDALCEGTRNMLELHISQRLGYDHYSGAMTSKYKRKWDLVNHRAYGKGMSARSVRDMNRQMKRKLDDILKEMYEARMP